MLIKKLFYFLLLYTYVAKYFAVSTIQRIDKISLQGNVERIHLYFFIENLKVDEIVCVSFH